VENGFEGFAEADRPRPVIRQHDLPPGVTDRFLAPEDLAHDGDVIAEAIIRPAPRLPVPPLDDLWPRHAQPGDESTPAGERLDGGGTHGRIRRRPPGELHHARAEADAFGDCGDIGKWRNCVRPVGLSTPHRVIPQLLGPDDARERETEVRPRVADR
jgi:hypothetical protein